MSANPYRLTEEQTSAIGALAGIIGLGLSMIAGGLAQAAWSTFSISLGLSFVVGAVGFVGVAFAASLALAWATRKPTP